MADQNIYFTVMAESRTEAEAIEEAHRIAQYGNTNMPVTVRKCGTDIVIAKVFASGKVCILESESDTTEPETVG